MVSVRRRSSSKAKQHFLLFSLRVSSVIFCICFLLGTFYTASHSSSSSSKSSPGPANDMLLLRQQLTPTNEESEEDSKIERGMKESLPLRTSNTAAAVVVPLLRLTPEKAVALYRETVKSYVQQQTMSWHPHYTALEKDTRSSAEIMAARQHYAADRDEDELHAYLNLHHREIIDGQQQQQQQQSTTDHTSGTNSEQENDGQEEGGEETTAFIWDSEDDIPIYFKRLTDNCVKNASEPNFRENCFGLMQQFVWQPRCTVRLDSRYDCNGQESEEDTTTTATTTTGIRSVKDVLDSHFTQETLNIVIVGAGPSGLQLANGLAGLAQEADQSSKNNDLNIRVAMFESRTSQPGKKRPYSRNWILHLNSKFLDNVVDPVARKLFDVIHAPGRIQLPLHIYETILLLSTRARGVKFIYDDVNNYLEELAQVPNLLIFDATGHRLDHFEIQPEPVPTNSTLWSWEPMLAKKRFFASNMYKQLQETNSSIPVAERSTVSGNKVLCPVLPDGNVYRAPMLKVNDVRIPSKDWGSMIRLSYKLRTQAPGVDYCSSSDGKQRTCKKAGNICRKWCGRLYTWSSAEMYRRDIAPSMIRQPPEGIATTVMFASLSGTQADGMAYLMGEARGEISNGVDKQKRRPFVPLGELPFRAMSDMKLFRQNEFGVVLRALADLPQSAATSQVNLFTYQPYLYKDPVNRATQLSGIATVLRLGDSLASGDPNLSTGLMFHMQVIQSYLESIRQVVTDAPETAAAGATAQNRTIRSS